MKKEDLKTAILKYRDMIKGVENCEAWKRELKQLEDTYRYHYEGGNRPSHLPTSSNNTWIGCNDCGEWERQLDDDENENSFHGLCDNCHKQELYFYPSNNRKGRSGNSWLDNIERERERERAKVETVIFCG